MRSRGHRPVRHPADRVTTAAEQIVLVPGSKNLLYFASSP